MYLCSKNEKIFQKRGLKIQVYSQIIQLQVECKKIYM